MEAVRSTVLMHCVHKAGGWQPKAAGGWFALLIFAYVGLYQESLKQGKAAFYLQPPCLQGSGVWFSTLLYGLRIIWREFIGLISDPKFFPY